MNQQLLSQRVLLQAIDCSQVANWARQAGWSVTHEQVGRGSFEARCFSASCGQLTITNQFFNRELVICNSPRPDMVAVVFPFRGEQLGTFQGKPLGPDEAIVLCPEDEGILCTPPGLWVFTLSVPCDQLESALWSCGRRHLSQVCPGSQSIRFSFPWFHRLAGMVSTVTAGGLGLASRASVLEFEDDILQTIAEGLCGQDCRSEKRGRRVQNRMRFVRLARDYIDANLENEVRISQVATSVGITRRTLELAFRDVMGLTPLQYIRMRRLNRVRQQLLENGSESGSVAALAMENGLFHLGYFARDYQALFGELPSVTLNKGKSS